VGLGGGVEEASAIVNKEKRDLILNFLNAAAANDPNGRSFGLEKYHGCRRGYLYSSSA
jgi:hypothetical protein